MKCSDGRPYGGWSCSNEESLASLNVASDSELDDRLDVMADDGRLLTHTPV